ncbi:hypothetical protein MKW92_048522 [Papaver armeniacum]|nr:hypothetical protein MKW92_048522 [Papaver armeniacum]
MGILNLVSISFICLLSFSNLLITIQYTTAQSRYFYHFCSGDNYTANSTFQKNLNNILPALSSAVPSIIKNGYYNTSVGENPDIVYGSLQCRGDISLEGCQDCVKGCTAEINKVNRCPNSKQAIIWYHICMIRYSNQYYFNIMQDKPRVYHWNDQNATNPDQFSPALRNLLIGTAGEALTNNFATRDAVLNDFQRVYALVQCTADIPSSSCYLCLSEAIAEIQYYSRQGGKLISPSCDWRYELYAFFETTITPSPPQLSSPKPNSKGINSSKLAIRIAVPSAIAVFPPLPFGFSGERKQRQRSLNMSMMRF